MLSSHNILHPANGEPIAVPTQDMVLGLLLFNASSIVRRFKWKVFYDIDEAMPMKIRVLNS